MINRTVIALALALVALVLVKVLVIEDHPPKFPWHHLPGYKGWIGLVGSVVFIVVGKWLGKHFLQHEDPEESRATER